MKRHELLRRIAERARSQRVAWVRERQGTNHELWRCGPIQIAVPRHIELNEVTALGLCRTLEAVLGEGWWRE